MKTYGTSGTIGTFGPSKMPNARNAITNPNILCPIPKKTLPL